MTEEELSKNLAHVDGQLQRQVEVALEVEANRARLEQTKRAIADALQRDTQGS